MLRLEADRLIDGLEGQPHRPGCLGIDGERIAAWGEAGPGDLTLSLPGCTLLPGLIDFHSHVGLDTRRGSLGAQAAVSPARYLAAGAGRLQDDLRSGVTTLRLCGDRYGADLAIRRAVEEGRVLAPRLLAAGRAMRSPRCHGGAIASLIDTAGDFAIIAAVGYDVPTIDLRVDYLRPVTHGALTATARAVKAGRSFAVADIEVVAEDGKLVAIGRAVFKT